MLLAKDVGIGNSGNVIRSIESVIFLLFHYPCHVPVAVPHGGRTEYPCLVDLPDPKTQELRQYLVTENSIQECNAIQRGWGSWLAGNFVISDGTLHAWTPVNIVFLLLPALEKVRQQEKFCSIDHIVESMGNRHDRYAIIKVIEAEKGTLKEVCDWKENEDACFFKLNNQKLFDWLQSRVNSLETYLAGRYPSFATMPRASLKTYSVGILSEYLPAQVSHELYRVFGMEPVEKKNFHMADSLPKEPVKTKFDRKQQQKMRTARAREEEKERKRKKETAGMQKLTSFFGKR